MSPTPIAYNYDDAAAAVGLKSVFTIREAVRRGELIPRYPNSKTPIILHTELLAWAESLPVDKPEA